MVKRIIDYFKKKYSKNIDTQEDLAAWSALCQSIHAKDFRKISNTLKIWCEKKRSIQRDLIDEAKSAQLSLVEISKLQIFERYYSGDYGKAIALCSEFLKSNNFDLDVHVIELIALYQTDKFSEALAFSKKIAIEDRKSIERSDYWQLISAINWSTNQMADLEQPIDRALALAPTDPAILQTALAMYIELGLWEKVDAVRKTIANTPDCLGYAHSLSLLALREYEAGWVQMEGRYDIYESYKFLNGGLENSPRWRGESLEGKTLLISAEQGLGDSIQMSRYLRHVQNLNAKKIIVETQDETIDLFRHNFPEIQDIVRRKWNSAPDLPFDCWVGMMSLPLRLNAWGERTPDRDGYLNVPDIARAYWKNRLKEIKKNNNPCVGVTWSGQPAHRADKRRSIPAGVMMDYLRNMKANVFALQIQVPKNLPENVYDFSEEMVTLSDTAGLIMELDLVITVDTSVVHLAGALGKETWLLLPKNYEWRWGLNGEENDWYSSVRVLRQDNHGDWVGLLNDVFNKKFHHFSKKRS